MNTIRPYTVEDVSVFTRRGPWQTKSDGELSVLFSMTGDEVDTFLDRDNPAFAAVKESTGLDIRGLRSYEVDGIREGSVGGLEWHAARTEYVRAVGGSALWTCIDRGGGVAEVTLDPDTAVMVPPQIFHTYQAVEDSTRLQVICNTTFDPSDPRTHDTFFADTFTAQAAAFAAQYQR